MTNDNKQSIRGWNKDVEIPFLDFKHALEIQIWNNKCHNILNIKISSNKTEYLPDNGFSSTDILFAVCGE